MTVEAILLLGAGGHARACIDVIEEHAGFKVAGLIGVEDEEGLRVLGYPVLGTDARLSEFRDVATHALVAVGQITSAEPRRRLFERLEKCGYTAPVVVSPRAHVSRHAQLGAGTIVMHGAVVNAGATVGRNCIINSQSLVEHDVVINDHCHIATAAAINSGVRIGANTFIGSAASVRQGIIIGEGSVIGMGQRVLKDCPASTWMPQPS